MIEILDSSVLTRWIKFVVKRWRCNRMTVGSQSRYWLHTRDRYLRRSREYYAAELREWFVGLGPPQEPTWSVRHCLGQIELYTRESPSIIPLKSIDFSLFFSLYFFYCDELLFIFLQFIMSHKTGPKFPPRLFVFFFFLNTRCLYHSIT